LYDVLKGKKALVKSVYCVMEYTIFSVVVIIIVIVAAAVIVLAELLQ
jgi:hypothetical protein